MGSITKRTEEMEPTSSGLGVDPTKASMLSMQGKRQLVLGIPGQSNDTTTGLLQAYSRKELLETIFTQMGEDSRYKGYTKTRMIEQLIKLVSEKSLIGKLGSTVSSENHVGSTRRKNMGPLFQDLNSIAWENTEAEELRILLCKNVACRAGLSPKDAFCRRCSCCICHKYDDNMDATLWLTCVSDVDDGKESCGMSCHLECAIKDERVGIKNSRCCEKLDGSFYCVSCGQVNGLMRTWARQLLVAKEARTLDTLCLRLSLAYRILIGTDAYRELHKTVEAAVNFLEDEVGPLDKVSAMTACSILNSLSCGAEVQKLCASAVEYFQITFPDIYLEKKEAPTCAIHFEDCSASTVVIVLQYDDHLLENIVGWSLWHRMSTADYPKEPTFIIRSPQKRVQLDNLCPSTEYFCKVSLFSNSKILSISEAKWATPSLSNSAGVVMNDNIPLHSSNGCSVIDLDIDAREDRQDGDCSQREHPKHIRSEMPSREANGSMKCGAVSLSTPSKTNGKRRVDGSSCGRQSEESGFDYSVRVVKWLENEGLLDKKFRMKFLGWFSLKATKKLRNVVNVLVDVLVDDPQSLAEQLVDTFMDEICCEPVEQQGCNRSGPTPKQ